MKNGINADFNINLTGKAKYENHLYKDRIHYFSDEWIPYEKVLAGVLNSNVVLEILQSGQNGPSLRYYEAICYNKKLITTNRRAMDLPYYNPQYIKSISGPEDIDIEWIKKKENVDFGYRGDFSPIHLIEAILRKDVN